MSTHSRPRSNRARRLLVAALTALALGAALVACAADAPPAGDEPIVPDEAAADDPDPDDPADDERQEPAEDVEVDDPELLGSAHFVVPFSMDPDAEGRLRPADRFQDQWVDFRRGENEWLMFTVGGPGTVDGWTERLVDAGAEVSDPFETEIGGVPATAIDALNTREWRAITITAGVGENWTMYFEADDAVRIHVLEVEGHTITVIELSDADDFEDWTALVEPVLASVRWSEAP